VQDVEKQLGRLIGKRFIADTPFERLQHFPRYLKAIALRLDKLKGRPGARCALMAEYAPLWTNYERRAIVLAKQGVANPQVEQFRWLLEELRVQLFAQELRTPAPVSTKRLQKMWEGVVFSFGGIGNTPDDHTRQAAALKHWASTWSCIRMPSVKSVPASAPRPPTFACCSGPFRVA
jgi:hypothetical protein